MERASRRAHGAHRAAPARAGRGPDRGLAGARDARARPRHLTVATQRIGNRGFAQRQRSRHIRLPVSLSSPRWSSAWRRQKGSDMITNARRLQLVRPSVTLEEVSSAAGVSKSTASRALCNEPNVKAGDPCSGSGDSRGTRLCAQRSCSGAGGSAPGCDERHPRGVAGGAATARRMRNYRDVTGGHWNEVEASDVSKGPTHVQAAFYARCWSRGQPGGAEPRGVLVVRIAEGRGRRQRQPVDSGKRLDRLNCLDRGYERGVATSAERQCGGDFRRARPR